MVQIIDIPSDEVIDNNDDKRQQYCNNLLGETGTSLETKTTNLATFFFIKRKFPT